jgi:L-ribulose-5-phosphate 3-epimerase
MTMSISRREWLGVAASASLAVTAAHGAAEKIRIPGLRIGVTDWNLGLTTKVEAFELARKIGFEGVEVSFGRPKPGAGRLPIDDPALLERYQAEVRRTGLKIASMCLDVLHADNLKDNPLGPKWLGMAIPIAKQLKAPSMLLPMFGKNQPQNTAEMDALADKLKDFVAEARKSKVILALENTLSAENNARIIERVGSPALGVFYDVGNALFAGLDPVKEIRWLGKKRIAAIHLKDRGWLGEGKVDFPAVMQAIADIGYQGFADLETSNPTKDVEADMGRNLKYVRSLLA